MKVPKARKLKSGTWFIQLRLNGESISVTGDTQKECTDKALAIKSGIKAGMRETKKEPEVQKLPTLGEAIDAYIKKRDAVLSPSTIRGYNEIKRTRFKDFTDTSLSDMSPELWQVACNMEARLCSGKTLKNAWGFICSVLRENGIVPPKVKLPQVIANERPFLDYTQIKTFINAVHGTDIEIPALLALHSLRRSELMALRWENIDFDKRVMKIKGAAVYNMDNKFVQKKENKNTSSARVVPILMDELYDALKEKEKPEGLVVEGNPNSIWIKVNKVCAANSLPEIGFHGLRHSFASLAYHLNVPEKVVMELGGWSDYQTMRKIYTHIAQADIDDNAQKFRDFFNPKPDAAKVNIAN